MQQVQERIWPDANLRLLFELSPGADMILYNAQGVIAVAERNIDVVYLMAISQTWISLALQEVFSSRGAALLGNREIRAG